MTRSWFQPTSAEAEPLWVPNHRRRSTFDFLQTCILTLVLCAWTAIHLNVPSPKSRHCWWRRARDKVIWMLGAIFVPEGVFVIAFSQYWEARKVCKILARKKAGGRRNVDMPEPVGMIRDPEITRAVTIESALSPKEQDSNEKEQPEPVLIDHIEPVVSGQRWWSHIRSLTGRVTWKWCYRSIIPKNLELGFFIVMGGYEVVSDISSGDPKIVPELNKAVVDILAGSPTRMDGSRLPRIDREDRDHEGQKQQWLGTLTPRGAILLDKYGALPRLTTAQINDKSKANWLAKCLVCIQATWMLVQCVARKIAGLPVTLLELNTVMHVICALLMYFLWLHKPLDVSVPEIITSDQIHTNNQIPQNIRYLLCRGHRTRDGRIRDKDQRTLIHQHSGHKREYTIHRAKIDQGNVRDQVGLYLGVLSSWVYGGIHLTPWASHFPTVLERILWRASGLIIVGAPVVFASHALIGRVIIGKIDRRFGIKDSNLYLGDMQWTEFFDFARTRRWWHFIHVLMVNLFFFSFVYFCGLLYAAARVYLVIEAFASLRSLPVGSYTSVNWVEMFPHL